MALRPPSSSPTIKKIEFGNGVRHVIATDGKRAVYLNDDRSTLYFGDVAGSGRNVVFTAQPDQRIRRVLASPDLTMVHIGVAERSTLGPAGLGGKGILKNTDGTGGREVDLFGWFSRTPTQGGIDISVIAEWSGSGRYLLAGVHQDRQLHLAKISVDDGQVAVLPPLSRPFRSAVSSPDDRFIALGGESGLYIIPSQGGEPRQLIADAPGVMAWTGDGKYSVPPPPERFRLCAADEGWTTCG